MVQWTVDVESDWGGRSAGTIGLREGLPRILEVFKQRNIKAILFVSTELIKEHRKELYIIKDQGHRIGSHGHFHQCYQRPDRALQDAELSMLILHKTFGPGDYPFRAPKFSFRTDDIYSDPKNHVSVLKHMWVGQKVHEDSIFYIHPFDIVRGKNPPNLFCQIWYAHPEKAFETFLDLTERHHPSINAQGSLPQAAKSGLNSHD